MAEVEPKPMEEDPSTGQTRARPDFSGVRGFQVLSAERQEAGADEPWRDALGVELASRAERFRQAVDAAIVLSSDGVIRWLGDPVARLTPGPNVLTPGTVILAEEALPAASQELVRNRVDLWLASMMRRVLGPLFALEAWQEGSEVVRELANKLSQSLGILEREPIRRQINALAQNERAELRKLGARFGAYYIFVPALVKPAARTLALQLWSLQAPGDPNALMRSLGPLASSGRTSLPLDGGISRESYRIAGYRPCGERIVRVDVVERLSGITRAAIVENAARGAPERPNNRAPNGFVVSGQMTSLTGCSGGQFASILRSLGFQSVRMTRADFFGSPSAIESPQKDEPPEPAPHDPGAPHVECEKGTSAELVLASPGPSPADGARGDIAPPDAPAVASFSDASAAKPSAEPSSSGTSTAGGEGGKNAELIDVWRLEKSARSGQAPGRRIQHNRSGSPSGERLRTGAPSRPGHVDLKPVPASEGAHKKNQRADPSSALASADARDTATRPPPCADPSNDVGADEKRRQTAVNRDMPRSRPASGQQPRPKVDPNSPFAKLLEIRSLLVRQADKRS